MPLISSEAPRRPIWPYLLALAVYLSSGAYAFFFLSNDCDLYLYAHYADVCRSSSLQTLYQTQDVEYPPLAVVLMTATRAVADALPPQEQWLSCLPIYRAPDGFRRFKLAFRMETAAVYVLLFPLLLAIMRKCFPGESAFGHAERLLVVGVSGGILGPLLFDKLDLVLAGAVLTAFALLIGRRRYFWAYAALAAAVAYKVVPLALTPIWVLASLPNELLRALTVARFGRLAAAVAFRLALLCGMIVGLLAPVYWMGGPGAFAFLGYHSRRGVEFESSYAALLAVLKAFGYPCDIHAAFGSAEVRSSLSPLLANLAPGIVGLMLLLAAAALVVGLTQSAERPSETRPISYGQSRSPLFAGFVLLFLLIVVVANKVWSPQYLLWLLPFVPLAPLPIRPRRLFFVAFLAACLLTRHMYPGLQGELLGRFSLLDPQVSSGPTTLGACLLGARCLLLVGMTGLLAAHRIGAAGRVDWGRVIRALCFRGQQTQRQTA